MWGELHDASWIPWYPFPIWKSQQASVDHSEVWNVDWTQLTFDDSKFEHIHKKLGWFKLSIFGASISLNLGGGFKYCSFYFHPILEDEPISTIAYFSKELVKNHATRKPISSNQQGLKTSTAGNLGGERHENQKTAGWCSLELGWSLLDLLEKWVK